MPTAPGYVWISKSTGCCGMCKHFQSISDNPVIPYGRNEIQVKAIAGGSCSVNTYARKQATSPKCLSYSRGV